MTLNNKVPRGEIPPGLLLRSVTAMNEQLPHGHGRQPDRLLWVKNRSVRVRAARPFYPQVQTSSARPGMSVWCQRTFADIAAPYSGCQRTSTSGFGFSLTGQMRNSHQFFPARPSVVASPNERKAAPLRRRRPPPHCSQSCWRVRLCGGDDLIGRLALRGRFASASSAKVCVNLRK